MEGIILSESQNSPLARLVLFLICLSLVGTLVAGVYWYAVALPQQKTLAPVNGRPGIDPIPCQQTCYSRHCIPLTAEQPLCDVGYPACLAYC